MRPLKRILLLDDDPSTLRLVRLFLVQDGFEVLIASDGLTGMKLVEQEQPDLVLCDIALPGLSGLEVCERIRGNSDLDVVKIAVMTSVATAAEAEGDARSVGVDALITKPIVLENALRQIYQLLGIEIREETAETQARMDTMREVAQIYATRLPGKVDRALDFLKQLQEDISRPEVVKQLYFIVHSLAGSAPSLGYSVLGRAARRLDLLLRSAVEAERGLNREELSDAVELMAELSPASKKPDTRVERLPSPYKASPDSEHSTGPKLVYLVDDDREFAADLAVRLEIFDYEVVFFDNLKDFSQEVRNREPSAVIMDMVFPGSGTSGSDTIEALREEGQLVGVPVVFLSIRADVMARLAAVRAEGSAYFCKPVHIYGLLDKLDLLTRVRVEQSGRVLIVEDDQDQARYYQQILQKEGMDCECVQDPIQTMRALVEFEPDLVLMDLYMPNCSGMELAKIIRQHDTFLGLPIVFLSVEHDRYKHFDVMEVGVDDFLTKPIRPEYLVRAVKTRVERFRKLRSSMTHDGLTGLLNHSAALQQLSVELERARRAQGPLTVAFIDIDKFKEINDRFGHPAGDLVLKNLARLLAQRLRRTDIIARMGGEEFLVLLPGASPKDACRTLDKIREGFGAFRHQAEDAEFFVTFSLGVACYPELHTVSDLLRDADLALYRAKARGRNRMELGESAQKNLAAAEPAKSEAPSQLENPA